MIFAGSALRADRSVLAANRLGQEGLWRFGISGDRPIVLARFRKHRPASPGSRADRRPDIPPHQGARVRPCFPERRAGRLRGRASANSFWSLVRADGGSDRIDQPGGVFVLKAAVMQEDEKILLQAAARVVLVGDRGSLASQLDRTEWRHPLPGPLAVSHDRVKWDDEPVQSAGRSALRQRPGRLHAGWTGILSAHLAVTTGRTRAATASRSPRRSFIRACAPPLGCNVVANPVFGFLVSESGLGLYLVGEQPDEPADALEQ